MSNANFVIKYIETSWHDKFTLLELVESQYHLLLDEVSKEKFEAFTTIYPNVEGLKRSQIAISYTDRKTLRSPVIVLPGGTTVPLKKIEDPNTGKIWWVEPGEWNSHNKEWRNNTHRTAGAISFRIGKQNLKLHVTLSDASKDDLDKYLIDFKSGMWELILDERSYIHAEAKKGIAGSVDETALKLVDSILSAGRHVLKKPKSELREIQTLKPRKAVKPVPRTFMEIATKGESRQLTSRGVKANFNVAENCYVLYVLMATQRIVSQLCRVSRSKTERLSNNLEKLQQRADSLKNYKEVNRDLVVKDYKRARFEQNINSINIQYAQRLAEINSNTHSARSRLFIRLGKKNDYGAYFCLCKSDINEEWRSYRDFQFSPIELDGPYSELFREYTDYEITADFDLRIVSGGQGVVLSIVYLSSIQIVGIPQWLQYKKDRFKKMEQAAIALKDNGWKKSLTAQEIDEQNKERTSILNRKDFFNIELKNVSHVYEFLAPKEKQLRELIKKIKALGVFPKSSFPNSMTFVQNPSYQAVHGGYKKLKEQVGLTNEDLLMSLEKVDSIGLVNIPLLYERWCLLQLIKSFIHSFRFQVEDGWKRKLLRILENKHSNDVIYFFNNSSKREISLSYEPRLSNGKTPDFVLDMTFETKEGANLKKRVVLDAKFYSRAFMRGREGLNGVLEELARKKGYSENGENAVYVLHPEAHALEDAGGPVSPQEWGAITYLGELRLFDWDSRKPPHQYGAVCLNPLLSHQHSDEMQRLIGMLLQYEPSKLQQSDDVESHNFCIGCGSSSLRIVPHNQRNSKKLWYQCNECELFTVYNHCHSCNHRLIKNGEYWTYHSTMPMQPTNIKCPKCESPV
ncbi:nuclease domain-containing protein [Vibrio sp. 10N.286.51.F4]|uniref:nuclease domain-containing protein n=1 Tax=unclassified Vibrio TaxID=2614977 RepID=UPI0010BCF0C9|nr:nuclease domain-containing protein [Vibrio sp. F13]TKF89088.1 EstP [Vibrio sp. F13]